MVMHVLFSAGWAVIALIFASTLFFDSNLFPPPVVYVIVGGCILASLDFLAGALRIKLRNKKDARS